MIIDKPRPEHIRNLRQLWQEAFGDTDAFLDTFFDTAFSPERCFCVLDRDVPVSVVYWFDCACREKKIPTLMEKLICGDLARISGKTAFTAAKQGDTAGKEVVDTYIDYLACGIANMINIFQPEVLSIGGGICHEGDYLLIPLKERVFKEVYTKEREPKTKLVIAELGNDAGIIGAASLGW